jgi:hypothetical protein
MRRATTDPTLWPFLLSVPTTNASCLVQCLQGDPAAIAATAAAWNTPEGHAILAAAGMAPMDGGMDPQVAAAAMAAVHGMDPNGMPNTAVGEGAGGEGGVKAEDGHH